MKQFSITTQKLILVHNYVFNYFCKKNLCLFLVNVIQTKLPSISKTTTRIKKILFLYTVL